MKKIILCLLFLSSSAVQGKPIKILFLGDQGHHQPVRRFRLIEDVLRRRQIQCDYTEQVSALNAKTLNRYDGLLIYANIARISPEQEKALLDYVASGKGFIPIHCASYCFLNSPKYVALVGAQFRSHGTGVFRVTPSNQKHPLIKGFDGFESWDETYTHHKHNEKDRIVLSYREEKGRKEPWTWVRTHGKGRVFYTAWGHDARTWSNPGFQNLLERGIRWAVGDDPSSVPAFGDKPEMTKLPKDAPFKYIEGKLPFYPAGKRWGTLGDSITKMQAPMKAEESMRRIVTPVDFEVKLFAAEPDIGKPICMAWDERGRLWLAETVDYPNEMQPKGKGRDRIRICEDTDGDGRADKFTIFAEDLSIPTSLTFHRGGLIVHQAPDTLYLKDTDGDDKADVRKVLFTGWATNDTHAGPSNLRYGLDNWLWGMVGYAGYSGNVGGERHSFRTGFYRFKPDGSKMEFVRNTNNNSWGVGISEEGVIFGSTANGYPSVHMPIPNRYYEKVRGWSSRVLNGIAIDAFFHPITDKVRQVDWHGKFTAGAGHALYTARTYPKLYWNRAAFVNGPTGHLTATFLLQRNGSGYISRNAFNLVASDDEWTAPIVAEVGPDGNVWVIDWYNIIVQHNPTPHGYKTGKGNAYMTKLRDKKHGRVYRIVHKNAKKSTCPNLAKASPQELVATLKHDNMLWRLHAQRLLVERGKKDVVPDLVKLTQDESVDEIGLNPGVIHALWTLHGLGAITDEVAGKTVRHRSAGVRRNAVQVLATPSVSALHDSDAQVRLMALLRLADAKPDSKAGIEIASILTKPENLEDRWLPDAMTSAAAAHDESFLSAVSGRKLPSRAAQIVAIVAEHYARSAPRKSLDTLLAALAKGESSTVDVIIRGLAKGWSKKQSLTAEGEKHIATLFTKLSSAGQGQLIKLSGYWGSTSLERYRAKIAESFVKIVENEDASPDARLRAARQLISFQPNSIKAVESLLNVVDPRSDPKLNLGILETLQGSQADVGKPVLSRIKGFSPGMRKAAIRLLISSPKRTPTLLDALEKGTIQIGELALDQQRFLQQHPQRAIAARAKKILARGGSLPSPDREKVLAMYLPILKKSGDAKLGLEVFKKQCAKCHMFKGEGAQIGPDLTGMAVHPKEELLTHILDPNRSVEGNFRVYTVETENGKTLAGMLVSETKTTLELYDAEGKKHIILREDIDTLTASNNSLMPVGFEKEIKPEDMLNLLEALTQRGKFLPLPLRKVATVVSTQGMFFSKQGQVERLIFPDWKPKTFQGVPFQLVDPQGSRVPNVILLHGPQGNTPPKMPKRVSLPCNSPAGAIHFLSGVSGWGFPFGTKGSVSMIVRLTYSDGKTEDHELKNGIHFADYIRRVDVPESKFAFKLRGQQIRYLSIHPKRKEMIKQIDLIKGSDRSAPIVMAVTVETR